MIIVILILSIVMITLSVVFINKKKWLAYLLGFAGFFICFASICGLAIAGLGVASLSAADRQITAYEKRNATIRQQIATTIEDYQKEQEMFCESIIPERAIEIVNSYPDLLENKLVQSQIEAHRQNDEAILELQNAKAAGQKYQWWLYFGLNN